VPALRKYSLFDENTNCDSMGTQMRKYDMVKSYRKTEQAVSGFQTKITIRIMKILADY
jgi:hypothetical protein